MIDFKRDVYRMALEQLAIFLDVDERRPVGLSPYGRRRKPRPRPMAGLSD